MNLQFQVPLGPFTTLGIGGPARFFASVSTIQQWKSVLSYVQKEKIPFFILGRGSNVLFDDKGFDGLVIHNKMQSWSLDGNRVRAEGGVAFPLIGRESSLKNLTGLEFAAGIPASVGGAVFMNAGAHGQSVASVIEKVRWVTWEGEEKVFQKEDMQFGYRFSSLQKEKGVIVEAEFSLQKGDDPMATMEKFLEKRRSSQPIREKSAGCFFKNPPEFSAGYLIDKCGLKGKTVGGAKVSEIHANFLVNTGSASSKDILDLMACVQDRVYKETQISLVREVIYIPFDQGSNEFSG